MVESGEEFIPNQKFIDLIKSSNKARSLLSEHLKRHNQHRFIINGKEVTKKRLVADDIILVYEAGVIDQKYVDKILLQFETNPQGDMNDDPPSEEKRTKPQLAQPMQKQADTSPLLTKEIQRKKLIQEETKSQGRQKPQESVQIITTKTPIKQQSEFGRRTEVDMFKTASQGSESESQKSQKLSSHIDSLIYDNEINQTIPQLKRIRDNLTKGNITVQQARNESAELMMYAAGSNAKARTVLENRTRAIISGQRQQSLFQPGYQEKGEQSKSKNEENAPIEEVTVQKAQISPEIIQGQGVNTVTPTSMVQSLQVIEESNKGTKLAEKAQDMIDDIQIAQKSGEISKELAEAPKPKEPTSLAKEENVDEIDQLEGDSVVKSITDIADNSVYQQFRDQQLAKYNLTDSQMQLAYKQLFSGEGLQQLIDDFGGASIKTRKYRQQDKQVQAEFAKEGVPINLDVKDSKGNPVSNQQIFALVEKAIQDISKIQGDVAINTALPDLKKQTQVFSTKVKQNESGQFQIQNGSAFLLRQCC